MDVEGGLLSSALPLSRLLALYTAAAQGLYKATQRFLGAEDGKVPYIIGVAGSVAVGKSTTSRILQALLRRWPRWCSSRRRLRALTRACNRPRPGPVPW